MPRIASLLASATEMVAALDLADQLVGISHECDHPPEVLDRPRLSRPFFDPAGLDSGAIDRAVRSAMAEHGAVYTIDASLLEELRPDVIFTQAVCDVCAVPTASVHQVVADTGLDAHVVSLDAHTLAGILATIVAVGEACGQLEEAERLAAGLGARIQAVRDRVRESAGERPRVLALEWLDPPFTPGHWVPEMIEVAGGVNLVGGPGERSRDARWEELEGLDPDVLVVMPCGFGLAAAREDADRARARLMAVAPRAIREGRAWVVDASSYFNRSGPRVVRGIEILAELLHGGEPDGVTAARWPDPST